jgi:hypothetical protein
MMTKKMNNQDATINEIHRTRERIAEEFGGDIEAILDDARQRQAASGRTLWRGPSSLPGPTIPRSIVASTPE